ncbi:myrosinase 1-like [Galleria mellonella]|uniref:Myrosinase 1-like n=1 Tax=Galleria mellonella TaxID=7137 RepID=A0A6J3C5V1_GALME|nr:myrosinase 1-like [Galleria mellonella]
MYYIEAVVFGALITARLCSSELSFPPGFKFGVATAAYQIEGGWNISDKSHSIWDTYTHEHEMGIADHSTGDVACDSYHLWRRDIELLTELGVDFYRFSISWTRLMPSGYPNRISKDGTKYYNNLIDELLARGIEPIVTLYHWDLPQQLQYLGGWTNPYITDWFAEYARVVFSLFADRVKIWVTINEPVIICDASYSTPIMAPATLIPDNIGTYICNKNVLIAHAKAYRIYDKEFRPKYHGMVSIVNNIIWVEPVSKEYTDVTNLALQNLAGRFTHPVYSKEGGWPPEFEKLIAEISKSQGYHTTRLPAFTKEEVELVKGSYDYFGLNHYTSRRIRKTRPDEHPQRNLFLSEPDLNYIFELDPDWTIGCNGWLALYPEGFRRLLTWIKKEYGDIKILITENGYPTKQTNYLNDEDRIQFYKDYLKQMMLAIYEDGVNVIGYTAWSLIDNFEWMDGYSIKFGLYEVNFTDPQHTRTPRKSAKFYADLIKNQKQIEAQNKSRKFYTLCSYLLLIILIALATVMFSVCWKTKADINAKKRKEMEANSELLMEEVSKFS